MVTMQPRYAQVVSELKAACVPIRQLDGRVAVTLAAGRIVALSFSANAPNLFWSNPKLSDMALAKQHPKDLVGGLGGDRLWFAPDITGKAYRIGIHFRITKCPKMQIPAI